VLKINVVLAKKHRHLIIEQHMGVIKRRVYVKNNLMAEVVQMSNLSVMRLVNHREKDISHC